MRTAKYNKPFESLDCNRGRDTIIRRTPQNYIYLNETTKKSKFQSKDTTIKGHEHHVLSSYFFLRGIIPSLQSCIAAWE